MIKEYNNNEKIVYATSPIQVGLADVSITIARDSDGITVVDGVIMVEYIDGFYKYELGDLGIGTYTCYIEGTTVNRDNFLLTIAENNTYDGVLTEEEHNAIMEGLTLGEFIALK